MQLECDVLIVGLGGMGASAAYQLSKRNLKVIGVEQFNIAHKQGSSHGESRIVRQACFEGPKYGALSIRSYELLDELERKTNKMHSRLSGGLMIGGPNSAVVQGSIEAAKALGLPSRVMDTSELRKRAPALNIKDGQVAFYEETAGSVLPEMMIESWAELARLNGATLIENSSVTHIEPQGAGLEVQCDNGTTVKAGKVIITAGPWLGTALPEFDQFLHTERIVQHWFKPQKPELFTPENLPIFYWDLGPYQLYGFPALDAAGQSVKIGLDNDRSQISLVEADEHKTVSAEEIERLNRALKNDVPALYGGYARSEPCLWTMSKDRDFVIGAHPLHDQIIVAGGFSGRGFKFAAVVGEIVADLAEHGHTKHDISLFSSNRAIKKTKGLENDYTPT